MNPQIEAVLQFSGLQLSVEGVLQLSTLAKWLRQEALPAGGLGPREDAHIESRHLAGSLLYASAWTQPPAECWDLGTGVGLPGLVLAIVWPQTRMVLIDRSAKRCDLARRAARVIGVEVVVRRADWASLPGTVEAIVSRAAAHAITIRSTIKRLLKPGGTAVVSGSGLDIEGFEAMEVPAGFFDHPSRLLIMRAT